MIRIYNQEISIVEILWPVNVKLFEYAKLLDGEKII